MKETGARPGEAWALNWTDIDFEKRVVFINDPEKNSLPRTFKISNKLLAMLNNLPGKNQFVFRENPESHLRKFTRNFYKKRITLRETTESQNQKK